MNGRERESGHYLTNDAERFMSTALNDLEGTMDTDPPANAHELVEELRALAADAALVAEYISLRAGLVCGSKRNHADAWRHAHRRYMQIRRDLGYSR